MKEILKKCFKKIISNSFYMALSLAIAVIIIFIIAIFLFKWSMWAGGIYTALIVLTASFYIAFEESDY